MRKFPFTSISDILSNSTKYFYLSSSETKLKLYNGNNTLECETIISYDLTKENKFNQTFKYFQFQDILDEDISSYLFLGKNNVQSTTNSCSNTTVNYIIGNNTDN